MKNVFKYLVYVSFILVRIDVRSWCENCFSVLHGIIFSAAAIEIPCCTEFW